MPRKSPSVHNISLLIVLLIIICTFLLPTHHSSLIFAQTPTSLEKGKQDYSVQLKKYNSAQNEYITAKANYLSFKTATAKKEAFDNTKQFLTETNFLIVNYLFVVKEFGNIIKWENTGFDKNNTILLVDEELNYLQNHWQKIQSTTTLEELPPLSEELEEHLKKITKPRVNKVLITFEIVKIAFAHEEFSILSTNLISLASEKLTNENRSLINNWQSEIENINTNVKANLKEAQINLEKIRIDRENDSQTTTTLKKTDLAKIELARSKGLFEEILRII